MFVLSVKASRKRLIPVILCIALITAMLIAGLCFPTSRTMMTVAPLRGDSDEACAAYLMSLGWTPQLPATDVREVALPTVFDDALNDYNVLQAQAGFDLSGYAGQRVKYRTYTITDSNAQAHIYVYKGYIIGGDIQSDSLMPLCKADAYTG